MTDTATTSRRPGTYVCPDCRSDVALRDDSYNCKGCSRTYPILFGIPDFRLTPDPYLTLEKERAKAGRLHAYALDHTFEEVVREYYRITDDVSPALALKYSGYVNAGEARGAAALPKLGPAGQGVLLDAGCGAGGLVMAAAREKRAVCGVDIALRWLVIAAKRLDEAGLAAELVCADITAPPFRTGSFAQVAAVDLFEHVGDGENAARSLFRLMSPDATLWVAGSNRYTLASHPVAGHWGVGFLPVNLRRRYVTARRGLDTLRYATLIAPGGLARLLRKQGFAGVSVAPIEINQERGKSLRGMQKLVRPLYSWLRKWPLVRQLLVVIGPAFELVARKPNLAGMGRKSDS